MRVPSSPKPRTPSPNRPQRTHLRPLLLANRARTTLPRPTPKRTVISSPRNYKMTKSAADRLDHVRCSSGSTSSSRSSSFSSWMSWPASRTGKSVPEIKVIPPAPSPALWGRGTRAALAGIDLLDRSSFPSDTPRGFAPLAPGFDDADVDVDPHLLGPNYVPPVLPPCPSPPTPPPVPPRTSPWHINPNHGYSLRPAVPRPPHRAAKTWDVNFMPTIALPGPTTPINNPSRERIMRHHEDEIGRAL